MKICKICVSDYRSLGDNTVIGFASNIAVLVGKNETGKSNFLDALSKVRFFEDMGADVIPLSDKNRFREACCIKVCVDLEYDDEDVSFMSDVGEIPPEERKLSMLLLRDAKTLRFELGGLFTGVLQRDPVMRELAPLAESLIQFFDERKSWGGPDADDFYNGLRRREGTYVRNARKTLLDWCVANVLPHVKEEKVRKSYQEMLVRLVERLEKFYGEFRKIAPVFFKFEDSCELHDSYSRDELQNPRNHRTDNLIGLDRYLGAIRLGRKDLLDAFGEKNPSLRQTNKDKFTIRTENHLEQFNQSYMDGEAKIRLLPSIEGDTITFSVMSDGLEDSVLLGERSAGLRWYLNAFLESERSKGQKNSVLLVDEPAAFMHVNAQKDVLSLFDIIAQGSRYLLYTTHSPYMIDTQRLENVKAVVKQGGVSRIDDIHNVGGRRGWQDALTPICEAMGVELRHNVGPMCDRLNLLVEGPSDAYYIKAMMSCLNVEEARRPAVIPSMGVNKANCIEAILIGWGCRVCVIVDNDKAGRRVYQDLVQYVRDTESNGRVVFVSEENDSVIENLISDADFKRFFDVLKSPAELHRDNVKLLRAREFLRNVRSGEWSPDHDTKQNFANLFARAGIEDFEVKNCDG